LEGRKVAPPNGNCPSTTLNHLPVDPPRLLAPMPTVHHHVTDEAQMEPIGEALPKWLGAVLRMRINRLSRLPAGNAFKGPGKGAQRPLSIEPGLGPVPLLTAETVVALHAFVPFPIEIDCTIIGQQCYVRMEYNGNQSVCSAHSRSRNRPRPLAAKRPPRRSDLRMTVPGLAKRVATSGTIAHIFKIAGIRSHFQLLDPKNLTLHLRVERKAV
jgi:hypothetical protein